jgi:uncharacterized protein YkwD
LPESAAAAQYRKMSAHPRRTLEGEQSARTVQSASAISLAMYALPKSASTTRAEAWFVLATPFTPPDSIDPAELNRRVLELINEAREQGRRCGRKTFAATAPLQANAALEQAVQSHTKDMAENNFLGHKGSSGSLP